jgi:hypothetical protein
MLYSFLFFCNFDAYGKNEFPLLHKMVLHHKLSPACNTWHSWIVPTVINHFHAPLNFRICFEARKDQILSIFVRYSTLLTKRILKWNYSLLKPKIEFFVALCMAATEHLHRIWDRLQFCVFIVNSNIIHSFHHIMATKYRARSVMSAYAFSGASGSATQKRDSVRWRGGEAENKQTKKRICTFNFTI